MDLKYHKKYAHYERLYLDENFFNNLRIFDEEESKKIIEDYDKSDRILKIFYQLLGGGPSNTDLELQPSYSNISNTSNREKEITPYKVLPGDIELSNVRSNFNQF